MMGPTHRTGSLAVSTTMVACLPFIKIPDLVTSIVWLPSDYNILMAAGFIFLSIFGGLLPDADIPQSTIGRRYRIILFPLYLLKRLIGLLGKVFKPLKTVGKALGHRGLFHSPLFWTLVFAVLRAFTASLGNFIGCLISGLYFGALSHILLDYISGGVPLLAPFTLKRYKPPFNIKTDGRIEPLLNTLFVGISICMCILFAKSL